MNYICLVSLDFKDKKYLTVIINLHSKNTSTKYNCCISIVMVKTYINKIYIYLISFPQIRLSVMLILM